MRRALVLSAALAASLGAAQCAPAAAVQPGPAATQPAPPRDRCAAAVAVVPGSDCAAATFGTALAPDPAEAQRLAGLMREGEVRFRRHFGLDPRPYSIIQGVKPGMLDAHRKAGLGRALPWLTYSEYEESALGSVRRGTETQAKAQNVPADRIPQVVEAAVAKWRGDNTLAKRHETEAGVVPHEIGHLWYAEQYWPGVFLDTRGHYGGPGPDWMDETAAVLMESEAFGADRRKAFEGVYKATSASATFRNTTPSELLDLPLFLSREHPAKGLQERLKATAAPGATSEIRVLTGDEARQVATGAGLFYLQARLFADYLIERTGNPAVFGEIGAAFGRGETMEQWLATRGPALRLGSTIPELTAGWRTWLAARLGPPAPG